MTQATGVPASPAPERNDAGTSVRRLLVVLLGPLWVRTLRDPVRDGHLRLDALSRTERQAARIGLVLLAVILGSVLFADQWRVHGDLFQMLGPNELRFLPIGVYPVALFGLLVSWTLIFWGALHASPAVRLIVAALFVVVSSELSVGNIDLGQNSWVLEHGGEVMHLGYFVAPAGLALSALLHPVVRHRARLAVVVTWALRLVTLAGLVMLFALMLWAHVEGQRRGYPTLLPTILDGSVGQTSSLLLPLVYVAAITVVDFALDVSGSLAEPVRVLSRRWVVAVLVALLAVKLIWQVGVHRAAWAAELRYQPQAVVRTAICLALLAGLVALVTRFPRSETYAQAKERLMYGSSALLAGPFLISVVGIGASSLSYVEFDSDRAFRVQSAIPYDWLSSWGFVIAGVVAAVVGLELMRRSAGGFGDELGSAIVVVGTWVAIQFTLTVAGLKPGFSYPTVDLLVTLGAAVVLVVGWRRLHAGALVAIVTAVLFSWLVLSRGDYISYLGGLAGLPAILVVVVGVVLTLASGAGFAARGTRRLPANARPLLFVGYLLLSVVILLWVQGTHEQGQDDDSLTGFFYLGLPIAAWLLGRRIVPRAPEVAQPADEPAA